MRTSTVPLLLVMLTLAACTGAEVSVPGNVQTWAGELPISEPWLRDQLPPGIAAYQRIPNPLGLMAMPKGNMLDTALSSEANIRNLIRIQQGLEDNPGGEPPLVADPRLRALIAHLRSPVEIAVATMPAPAVLVGMTLDLDSNVELEALFNELAQYPPFPSLGGSIDDQGFGELVGSPLPAFLNFDAATGRLALYAGPMANRAAFASALTPGPDVGEPAMSPFEAQIDSSGQGFFGWLDTRQALQMSAAMIPPGVGRVLQMTGISELRSLAYGAGVADGSGRLKLIADLGTSTANRLLPVVDNRISASSVGTPRSLFLLSIPSPEEFTRLENLILTSFAPDAQASWADAKAAVAQKLGVSVDEILSAIGPELIAFSDQAGDYAGLKVRDRALFDDMLARLAANAGVTIEDHDYEGQTIRQVSLPRNLALPEAVTDSDASPLLRVMGRLDRRLFWMADGDYIYIARVPQLLMDRIRLGADTSVASWLGETQHVDLSASLLAGTGSIANLPRKIYEGYLGMMQAVADIVDVDYDAWSMPTASQLDLPERGALGFSVNLGQPYVSLELSYESHPAEILLAGGGVSAAAVVGVMAAIAIPAYQDYTIRAQVSEGLNLAAAVKAAVAEAYLSTGGAPADRTAAGLTSSPADTRGAYVAGIDVTDGSIIIRYGNAANARIADRTLALTPYLSADGGVVWACGDAAMPGLEAIGDDTPGRTTIARRYLPSACR